MKYLKKYSLFESMENISLSEVEEVFYNISDKLDDIKIEVKNLRNKAFEGDIIVVKIEDIKDNLVDIDLIRDDLEFAINYLTKELNLKLNIIHTDSSLEGYKSIEEFLKDNDYCLILKLYFI